MAVVLVRRERADDVAAVRAVVAAAFARPDAGQRPPIEVGLLDELRVDEGWLPALSLVATEPPLGEVVGHVVCTRATVAGVPVLGLGPLAVRPDRQRRGAGTALVHAVLGAAEALEEPLVVLLGDPAYYGRFGFRAASEYGIAAPDPGWGIYFQARPLGAGPVPAGRFSYATPFHGL
jgi:putative acetyltransferase